VGKVFPIPPETVTSLTVTAYYGSGDANNNLIVKKYLLDLAELEATGKTRNFFSFDFSYSIFRTGTSILGHKKN
jgi:hypothetical protein